MFTIKKDAFNQLVDFVCERHSIYVKKEIEKRPAPWTDDPILQDGKFGNVWRQLDRGTRWETETLDALPPMTAAMRVKAETEFILVYRHNLVPRTTKALLGIGEGLSKTDKLMRILNATPEGSAIVSDVIKIWPLFEKEADWHGVEPWEWASYALDHVIDVENNCTEFRNAIWGSASSPEFGVPEHPSLVHKRLRILFPRLGAFKAYEVLTSFVQREWWPWTDDDFPFVGHGAAPALRDIVDVNSQSDPLEPYLVDLLPVFASEVCPRLDKLDPNHLPITVRTLEDCLCEYRKYSQVKAGTRDNRPYPDMLGRW